MDLDSDRLWQAMQAGDARFDGWVYCGVSSTGIYCRPSCPARTPKRENVVFFATAAGAQAAGFRACKRCRPDAAPGSPEWDRRSDLVGRAMRMIADGMVDREGVGGLATRLGYSERHLHRELSSVVGAGPLALARAQRAQTARVLLETTQLPIIDVAFASGFHSVRQFNDTVQSVFAGTPTALRKRARGREAVNDGAIVLRLPFRAPLDAQGLIGFLGTRAVPGVEQFLDGEYRRSLRLPHGAGVVALRPGAGFMQAQLWLDDLRDLAAAVLRCRELLDLDSDPEAVDCALGADPLLGPLVRATPGRRVPGHVEGDELAIRAVLGQQVSVAGATTLAGRLVARHGETLKRPLGAVTHLFPSARTLAGADDGDWAMPKARRRALRGLAAALADGEIVIDPAADREQTRRALIALPGIGEWTASYVAMRALRDPDIFLAGDVGVTRALAQIKQDTRASAAALLAERWRPYRSYAVMHLWARAAQGAGDRAARAQALAA
jgi:AraC family transcriptional regulator of adaptative response / DNA-3-methyladenine glycosylase II